MKQLKVFIEAGKKKVFVGAVEWPGWCRFGRDEPQAMDTFLAYTGRYARVLENTSIEFTPPQDPSEVCMIEWHEGTVSTDFGAPMSILAADYEVMDPIEFLQAKEILTACWQAFDSAMVMGLGRELRKGPRGGGRDLDKIVEHLVEADRQYLKRLARTYHREKGYTATQELHPIRQAIFEALDAAERGELPEQGPRGGIIWPPRYFVRRVAWHVLDHAWEIEDRVV